MKFLPILWITVALVVCALAIPAPDHTVNRDKRSPIINEFVEAGMEIIGGTKCGAHGAVQTAEPVKVPEKDPETIQPGKPSEGETEGETE